MSIASSTMSETAEPKFGHRIPHLFIAFLTTALLLAPFLVILGYEVAFMYRVHPGVSVGGINLTGLALQEVQNVLGEEFKNYAEREILFRYGDRVWQVPPQELGITYDAVATSLRAYRIGREGDVWGQLETQWTTLLHGMPVSAVRRFDEGIATMYLSRLAREIDVPPRDPSLRLDGFQVTIDPGRVGRQVDIPATRNNLKAAIDSLSNDPVEVVVREVLPATIDVRAVQQQTENAIKEPLILTFRQQDVLNGSAKPQWIEKRWSLDQATIAGLLMTRQTKKADGSIALEIRVDRPKLMPHIERLAKQIDRPARDARFDFDPKSGQLKPLVASQEGYKLNVAKTAELVESQLLAGEHTVRLPVEVTRPAVAVENMAQMGIKELVAEATTSFKGSTPARIHNIQLAASKFDGVVIAPGEVFSFNQYLGEVSGAMGYQESQIIWGDRTAIGMGGGVCQVSTTAFRAAFWAGLPILERHNHGYRVSWYEPPVGLDATVFAPNVDLKFKNDMSHYILIKTHTDLKAQTVTFRFYGTSQGRVVEMSGPVESNPVKHGPPVYQDDPTLPAGTVKQVEWPHDGVDVKIVRVVHEGGKKISQDEFQSHYDPWPAMYLRGTQGVARLR